MDTSREPFKATLKDCRVTLVLEGDLVDSDEIYSDFVEEIEAFDDLPPDATEVIVDASNARMTPEGITLWIEIIRDYLMNFKLIYKPAQLDVILKCDDRYDHPDSVFLDA